MESTRQRRAWDRASYGYGLVERLGAAHRHLTVRALDLDAGESVLDVGCGSGGDLELLQATVGPAGRVVGVEFSPKLARAAGRRIEAADWSTVELRLADATKQPMGTNEFDAAVANCSLSTMPEVDAALDNIYRALRPGGRLMVWDVNPKGPFRLLYRLIAGAPGIDVSTRVQRRFDEVHMLDRNAEPTAWRSPAPWFMLLLAKKS
jgi:phosphatidylethanolamine/phosphatidyl-N-methylethanolamine N-methyltransferase